MAITLSSEPPRLTSIRPLSPIPRHHEKFSKAAHLEVIRSPKTELEFRIALGCSRFSQRATGKPPATVFFPPSLSLDPRAKTAPLHPPRPQDKEGGDRKASGRRVGARPDSGGGGEEDKGQGQGQGQEAGGERKEPRRDMDGRGGTGGGVVETQHSSIRVRKARRLGGARR